ncbi:hypothetical protein [Flagellimonas myxillae]|uniref:hypothetical protein n=1 Tax=Flagellimonas myxillae TaxID=2942214 RepID=UPI00201F9B61|nr:hypothetical protein [Muricauda myxillae]MCL6265237.1 hypothetical protein [Muricauda myxillae]
MTIKKTIYLGITILAQTVCFGQKEQVFQDPNELAKETQRIISIEAGQKIDTAYFKTLFLPSARFTVVGQENGVYAHETMDLPSFAEMLTDEYYSLGYHEEAIGEIVEEYNGIAQIIQSFKGLDSENVSGIGVGSYHLIYSDGRWWIANMIWTMSNVDGKDIPKKYLGH